MKIEEVKPVETRKKVLVGILVLVAILALSLGGYKAWLEFSDPPLPQTVDDIEDLLTDSRYQNMSREERRVYQEHMNEMFGSLNDDERRRLGELMRDSDEAMREAMDMGMQMMRNFHRPLADAETEQQRDQMLDGMIAMQEMQEARQRNRDEGDLRPSEENQEGEESRNQMERMMSDFLDSGDPQSIGYLSELGKLIEQRREERGMPPSGSNR